MAMHPDRFLVLRGARVVWRDLGQLAADRLSEFKRLYDLETGTLASCRRQSRQYMMGSAPTLQCGEGRQWVICTPVPGGEREKRTVRPYARLPGAAGARRASKGGAGGEGHAHKTAKANARRILEAASRQQVALTVLRTCETCGPHAEADVPTFAPFKSESPLPQHAAVRVRMFANRKSVSRLAVWHRAPEHGALPWFHAQHPGPPPLPGECGQLHSRLKYVLFEELVCWLREEAGPAQAV